MRITTLIKQNIFYHRKTHISLFLGTVLASAIIIGAFTVRDSVRESLKDITLKRLGNTMYGMELKEDFVREELAEELELKTNTPIVPILGLMGMVTLEGGKIRTPGIHMYGINKKFSFLTAVPETFPALQTGEALINQRLSGKLGLKPGDTFLLRFGEVSAIPLTIPFSDNQGDTASLRLKVKAVLQNDQLGQFSLRIHQVPSLNVYLPLQDLYKVLKVKGKVNILLSAGNTGKLTLSALNTILKKTWKPQDAGIIIERPRNNLVILRSEKIFIDPHIFDIIIGPQQNVENHKAEQGLTLYPRARGIFTYFVNEIKSNKGITPYSFVSAPAPPQFQGSIKDDGILINEWLARDLKVKQGDRLSLSYFIPGREERLDTDSQYFTVQEIIPVSLEGDEKLLVPPFPGLSGAGQCRDWDPGIPIDLDKIRKKDEEYWNTFGESPKAYISLNTAQKIWKNPFGNLTAIHFPGDKISIQHIENSLTGQLDPRAFGIEFLPIKENGLSAGENAVDFGGLFIGLSFFIITAGLLLLAQLIFIEKEYRSYEFGLLRSLGFSRNTVARIFLFEILIIILVGNVAGIFAGIFYNQSVLWGLNTIWKGAVGTVSLTLSVLPATLGTGFLISLSICVFTILLACRKLFTVPLITLTRSQSLELHVMKKPALLLSLVLTVMCILPVLILYFLSITRLMEITTVHFFLSGFLLLGGSISFCDLGLNLAKLSKKGKKPNLLSMGLKNLALRKTKSIVTISLLAFGIFVIMTIGMYQGRFPRNPGLRTSGTGGFALFGKTSLPIIRHTGKPDILNNLLSSFTSLNELSAVLIRLQEGDDASCLNLNQVDAPQVLGIRSEEFADRNAFSFAKVHPSVPGENPWLSLKHRTDNGVIPAIADQTVIEWGLMKNVGDIIFIKDEHGENVPVKLVAGLQNSVFQGNIIMSETFFKELYPSVSGYRMFLIDAPGSGGGAVAQNLSEELKEGLKTLGPEIETTEERLHSFSVVENTYLSIFLLLGGIGVLLGSLGFGIIVLRKIMEAKKEYAILRALGFRRLIIFFSIFIENILLLFTGLACGCIAGIGAFLLYSTSQGINFSPLFILIILFGILLSGIVWICSITLITFSKPLIPELRNE